MGETVKQTEEEINEVLNWAAEAQDDGSKFPGMTYEDGVKAMYDWLTGDGDRPDKE